MSNTLLLNFMRVAHDVTKAERAFAVDQNLTVIGTLNIAPEEIEAPYLTYVRQVMSSDKPIITDNYTMTIDPSKAPVTNQSFPKLRFVVMLPVPGYGAVCLDQTLRGGVTSKDKVDRLGKTVHHVLNQQDTDVNEDYLMSIYNSL